MDYATQNILCNTDYIIPYLLLQNDLSKLFDLLSDATVQRGPALVTITSNHCISLQTWRKLSVRIKVLISPKYLGI